VQFINAILIFFLILLQYKLWVGQGSLPQIILLEENKIAQIAENKRLQKRNQSLFAEIQDLKSGLDAIEEHARSEMGMIKSNEVFYQIVTIQNPKKEHIID